MNRLWKTCRSTPPSIISLRPTSRATYLVSVVAAIEGIVGEGEGASGDNEDSHYGRFKTMGDQYDQMLKEDRSFEPGRPVVSNPYSILLQDVGNLSSVNLLEDRLECSHQQPVLRLLRTCDAD